ncbi:tyrosine-type recombinase/integrase [Streptomyces sp. NPDC088810]|uniref:tyrosine-type recombinase/integrase n=1 Tax=Streptomyces sp. NPDC088810 TaxID=3365904 RepID=UPI00381A709C
MCFWRRRTASPRTSRCGALCASTARRRPGRAGGPSLFRSRWSTSSKSTGGGRSRNVPHGGMEWSPACRVFTTRAGEPLDAANVRRDFKAIVRKAGLKPEWTPRALRHSFVPLLSDHGIPLETIALLVTTEAIYRKQLRPMITKRAEAMDDIFAGDQEADYEEATP